MASRLPVFPRFVFTIFEPISLLSGALPAILFPHWFSSQQTPFPSPLLLLSLSSSSSSSGSISPDALLVTQQLGNAYLLLSLLGTFILSTTAEVKTVRAYLWALWIADLSHVYFTCAAVGWDHVLRVGEWNAMTWGNVGCTLALNLTRSAYFLGLFGEDSPVDDDKKKQ